MTWPVSNRAVEYWTLRPVQVINAYGRSTRRTNGQCAGRRRSANMLNVAAEAARKEGITNVETRVMNAENLELDADSFDAVICRIALMLFSNPAKALNEMRRVVKPGGKVAVMVFPPWKGIRTMGFPSQLFAAWETYPRQRRENPGCSHSALRECLKDSTARPVFRTYPSMPCRYLAGFPPQPRLLET